MNQGCKKNLFNQILECSIISKNQIRGNRCIREGFILIRMLLASMNLFLILKTKAKSLPLSKKNLKISLHTQNIQIKTQL